MSPSDKHLRAVALALDLPPAAAPDDPNKAGELAGKALLNEYENVSQNIEKLGKEMTETVSSCVAMLEKYQEAIVNLNKTVEAYREEGSRINKEINRCAGVAVDVSKLCEEFRGKISNA